MRAVFLMLRLWIESYVSPGLREERNQLMTYAYDLSSAIEKHERDSPLYGANNVLWSARRRAKERLLTAMRDIYPD